MLRLMRRREHTIARVIAAMGVAAGLCYLALRALFSLANTDLWLSLPVLLVEAAGFVGSALLTWALWPHPGTADVAPAEVPTAAVPAVDVPAVDVLVRVCDHGEHDLRATLMAVRSVARVSDVIVVDASKRASIASIATEFQVLYAPSNSSDRGGLTAAGAAANTSRVLLLDAGDVPTPDIVTRLGRAFVDERVAIVQGLGVSFADDSIEHGPHGRHDLTFERGALNPALGTRGCAMWTGSGSLIAVDALREAVGQSNGNSTGDSALAEYWTVSAELLATGWCIVAPVDVAVVALRAEHVESVVAADRHARVRAARRLVGGCRRSIAWRQRLAILAWCVRPLSGLRRAAFIAVLVLALYAGSAPLTLPTWLLLAAWLPAFVATSVGLSLLSGWRLRPGDRTRWSLQLLDPVRNGMGLVVAITAVTVVLLLRGISDQFTHALGRMPHGPLLGLIVVALWTLAMSLDALRLLARRPGRRGSARVVSLLPAMFGDRSAKIVDLTAHGAGMISQTAATVGEQALLVSKIATASGTFDIRVVGVVQSVTPIDGNSWRIGVKFGEVDAVLASALSEYCTVEPMWERLGVMPETSVTEARSVAFVRESDQREALVGRGMLRFLSIVAVAGAVASSVSHNFDATRASATWSAWVVVALAIVIGSSVLLGLISPSNQASVANAQALTSGSGSGSGSGFEPENSSSCSPDLAIR